MSMQTFQSKIASADPTSEQRMPLLAKLTELSLEDLATFSGQYGWNMWPA